MNKLIKYIVESRVNFNIDLLDIEDNEGEFSLSRQLYKSKSMKQEYIENNLFVDLGLPSGTKWCKYNLGCDFELLSFNPKNTKPSDWYGNYYAWGEIEEKDYYGWKSYKYAKNDHNELTKYCPECKYGYKRFKDNLTELLPEDDAAYQTDSSWRIPTREQCQELIDEIDSRWISGRDNNLYMNVKGLRGRLFTSKINGNEIFIPATGVMDGSSLSDVGSTCYLLSSSLRANIPNYAWGLYFNSDHITRCYGSRYRGRCIRPVLK